MDHVRYILYMEKEQEKKKWWATALSEPHIHTKSLTHPTTFLDTSIFLDSAYCYWLPILETTSSCCCSSLAAITLRAGQSSHRRWQETGITGPGFPLPLPCSIVHCIPLLNLGLSQKSLPWVYSFPLQSQWSYFSVDWVEALAVPLDEQIPALYKA